ncbi:hypothetical protein Hanom_Chr00s009338g01742651 [Helianthus anomalus]
MSPEKEAGSPEKVARPPEKVAGPPEKEAAAVAYIADVAGHFCRDFRAGITDIMSLISDNSDFRA